jgi:tetracycline resistance element regulator rteA
MAKTISIQIWIIFGYLLIILLIGGIAYTWSYEWQKVESLEYDNQQINKL